MVLVAVFALFVFMLALLCSCVAAAFSVNEDLYNNTTHKLRLFDNGGLGMAVASAGPYANNLAPDRQPYQHLVTQFFTGLMLFATPNQVF